MLVEPIPQAQAREFFHPNRGFYALKYTYAKRKNPESEKLHALRLVALHIRKEESR